MLTSKSIAAILASHLVPVAVPIRFAPVTRAAEVGRFTARERAGAILIPGTLDS